MMRISSQFDSGSIEVIDASNPAAVRLRLRKDTNSHWIQWFYFRVTGVRGVDCTFRFENAAESRWAKGWPVYRVLMSYDREEWIRLATDYDGQSLIIRHRPDYDAVYYAYAVPYPRERDRDFIARCQTSN